MQEFQVRCFCSHKWSDEPACAPSNGGCARAQRGGRGGQRPSQNTDFQACGVGKKRLFRKGGDKGDGGNKLGIQAGEGSDVLSQVQGRKGVYFLPTAFLALLYTFLSKSLYL